MAVGLLLHWGVRTPQLEFAEGNDQRSAMQKEIKTATKIMHAEKEELLHFKTAFEKAKM